MHFKSIWDSQMSVFFAWKPLLSGHVWGLFMPCCLYFDLSNSNSFWQEEENFFGTAGPDKHQLWLKKDQWLSNSIDDSDGLVTKKYAAGLSDWLWNLFIFFINESMSGVPSQNTIQARSATSSLCLPQIFQKRISNGNLSLFFETLVKLKRQKDMYFLWLTLFAPAYLSVSKSQGGHICPSYVFRVWFGLGFQIF